MGGPGIHRGFCMNECMALSRLLNVLCSASSSVNWGWHQSCFLEAVVRSQRDRAKGLHSAPSTQVLNNLGLDMVAAVDSSTEGDLGNDITVSDDSIESDVLPTSHTVL